MITSSAIKPFVCGCTDQGTVYIDYDLNKTHLYVFEVQCDENGEWTFDFEDLPYFDNEVERYIGLFKAIVSIAKTIYEKELLRKLKIQGLEDRFLFSNKIKCYDFKLPTDESIEDLVKAFAATSFKSSNIPLWNNRTFKEFCERNEEELFVDIENKSFQRRISSIMRHMIGELPSKHFINYNLTNIFNIVNFSNIVREYLYFIRGDAVMPMYYDTFGTLFEDVMWCLVLLICYTKLI